MAVLTIDLLADKALFCHNTGSLYVADVHLGKAGHFRQAGMALPGGHNEKDLRRLATLIKRYKTVMQRLIFLGDVFHSRHNSEWEAFCTWRQKYPSLSMILIEGNHDVLTPSEYHRARLQVLPEGSFSGELELRHHPKAERDTDDGGDVPNVTLLEATSEAYQISIDAAEAAPLYLCGHLHPGVTLYGAGRQREQLACFWQRGSMLMLPAFGSFTGLHQISPRQGDGIWGVTGTEIIALHGD